MTKELPITCESDYDPNSLPVRLAYREIFNRVEPVHHTETVTLLEANHRVCAENITSPLPVPNHNNSAMDGYAVRYTDLQTPDGQPARLKVIGKSLAGHPFEGHIKHKQCIRITTGAVMPADCDTIVMQEHVEVMENKDDAYAHIQIDTESLSKQKQGNHVRFAGESLKQGDIAVPKGRLLNAADIGLLASLGISKVSVQIKPKVAIITTGDEIRPLGARISIGEVYDSNRYTLMAMLQDLNCDVIDYGIISDDAESTREALTRASEEANIVIATGGASVGEADFVRPVFNEMGDVSFWKLAMRPGRPLSFGRLNNAVFFGLPGNPVSVMVTFYQFVKPAIKHWLGCPSDKDHVTGYPRFKARSKTKLKKRPGRIEYQRGFLSTDEDGYAVVEATGDQGSGILSSMTQANCFIVLDNDCDGVEANAAVDVEPFHGVF